MFISFRDKTFWFYLFSIIFLINCDEYQVQNEDGDPLIAMESRDQKSIIKQIKKVNEGGTYTFGYETKDGSFKYETKDVGGDDKDISMEFSDEITSEKNKTSPALFPEISSPTSKSNVIQSIPRKKNSSSTPIPSETSRPIYGHYLRQTSETTTPYSTSTTNAPRLIFATSIPSTAPRIVMPPNSQHTRPILQNGVFVRSTIPPQNSGKIEGQLIRPIHIDSTTQRSSVAPENGAFIRRVLVSRQPVTESTTTEYRISTSSSKPLLEELTEKEIEKSNNSGQRNNFRRQLSQEQHHGYDPQQHVLNLQQSAGDDTTDIYGSSVSTGTQRPLFTTTPGPRILPILQRQNGRPIQFIPVGYQNRNIRPQHPRPQSQQESLLEAPTTQAPITDDYQTQNVPVLSIPDYRNPPRVPPQYRSRPVSIQPPSEEYLREVTTGDVDPRLAYLPTSTPENEQYLRESPIQNRHPNGPVQFPQVNAPPVNLNGRRIRPTLLTNPGPRPGGYNEYADQPYPIPIPLPPQEYRGYSNDITSNHLPDDISSPVTVRDFQRLLNQLIYLQSKLQQLSQYYGFDLYGSNMGYDPRYQSPVDPKQGYQQRFGAPQGYYDPRYARSRAYSYGNNPEYLPPQVREMLLLRMLQLAINSEIAATNQMEVVVSKSPKDSHVRNVKILGEEVKPTVRSKRYPDPNSDEDMQYYE